MIVGKKLRFTYRLSITLEMSITIFKKYRAIQVLLIAIWTTAGFSPQAIARDFVVEFIEQSAKRQKT